jgi:hypothetical protein
VSRANVLELQRPYLIHGLVLLIGWGTYLLDRDDVLWRFIRHSPQSRLLEHLGFGGAAAAMGIGILLGCWRTDRDYRAEGWTQGVIRRRCAGEILHGIGLATLVPVAGFVLIVCGEAIRSVRYAGLKMRIAREGGGGLPGGIPITAPPGPAWKWLVLSQAGMWCAFVSMVIFSIILIDHAADRMFGITMLVSIGTRAALPLDHFTYEN